ncbi:MAG: GNAT family N-acetyltransferase [Acidimicrobiales bacterium]
MTDDRVVRLLARDKLANVMPLKMTDHHGDSIETTYLKDERSEGALIVLPIGAFPYDRRTYEAFDQVVIPVATSAAILTQLLDAVPSGRTIFKLSSPDDYETVNQRFDLVRLRAFLSYCDELPPRRLTTEDPLVEITQQLDDRLVPLFEMNDYARPELERLFSHGAASFAVFEGKSPVSVGLTFQNYDEVWEIGALRTVQSALRQGLSTKIVNAALGYLGHRSRRARYGVADSNRPSQRLAERCGLKHFLTVTHYSSHT